MNGGVADHQQRVTQKRVTLSEAPVGHNLPINKKPRLSPAVLISHVSSTTTTNTTQVAPSPIKSNASSPGLGGAVEENEPQDFDSNLEDFRKEAIWREMLEYRRKFERAQDTIDTLERERKRCEARLSAVDILWAQLVQEASLLLPSTSTAPNGQAHTASSPKVSDHTLSDEDLEAALSQRALATKSLMSRLQSLHTLPSEQLSPSTSATSSSEKKVTELEADCRSLLEHSLKVQESLRLLRMTHETAVDRLEKTHAELLRAEKKLDRAHSKTVAAVEGRTVPGGANGGVKREEGRLGSPEEQRNRLNGTPVDSSNLIKSEPGSISSSAAAAAELTLKTVELEDLKILADSRAKSLDELHGDRVALRMELDMLKAKLVHLPDEVVAESAAFRLLQGHVQHLSVEYELKRVEWEKATTEAESLREMQESLKEAILKEAADQVEEVQKRLIAKEADLTRIRSQREDLRTESAELKAKDAEKMRSHEHLKTLLASREDRIGAYTSEVRRLKMQIAAAAGDSQTVDLLASADEQDTLKELQGRLKLAEDLLLALRDQLRSYASASGTFNADTIVKSETQARQELGECKEQLSKLEALVGPEANVEVRELVAKLESKEAKLKTLEAQVKSSEHGTNMLYSEIDRLSAAWATLDEQNGSKLFNFVHLEEKLQRLNSEKAKSDNRYFAAMRQKDAIGGENTVLTKLAEKQQRAVEAASEFQHNLQNQLAGAEREVSLHQKNVRAYQDSLSSAKRENSELALRNEQHAKHIAELNSLLNDRISKAEAELSLRKKIEEQLTRVEREAKTNKFTSAAGPGDSSEVRELKKYNDDLSKMLKCSTCSLRFKGVIINRCGHLFCKECIDARLANRQRKCPTCGIAFGKDDVSNVYF